MTRADEYKEALDELVGRVPYWSDDTRNGLPSKSIHTISRALRIAEMLEGEPNGGVRGAFYHEMRRQGYRNFDIGGIDDVALVKAMAAELIKQAEKGE